MARIGRIRAPSPTTATTRRRARLVNAVAELSAGATTLARASMRAGRGEREATALAVRISRESFGPGLAEEVRESFVRVVRSAVATAYGREDC